MRPAISLPISERRAQERPDDRLTGAFLVGLSSPVLAARAALGFVRHGHVFDDHVRLGRDEQPIVIRSFAGDMPGRRLAYLFSVARGDVRFFGPRPLHPLDRDGRAQRDHTRSPGLMSEHRLRARTGIAYDSVEQPNPSKVSGLGAVGLMARYAVAEALGGGARPAPPRIRVLGVDVMNTTMEEAVDWVMDRAGASTPSFLAFVNPDCFNKAVVNPAYRFLLAQAARVLPDGIGVKMAARFQGIGILENVNGTDMFPRLCEHAASNGLSLYMLGARPGVAAAAADEVAGRFPGLRIAGTRDGYFPPAEEAAVVRDINDSGADILLVAMGVPRQEFWIATHLPDLKVGVAMGVGGLFDFYSGRIPRAPLWVREIGLEWVWRLLQEPGRMWRRYVVGNPVFLARAYLDARRRQGAEAARHRSPLLGYGYYSTGANTEEQVATAAQPTRP